MTLQRIDPRIRIGHVHLKVSSLERSLKFYRDALGFEVASRRGTEAVYLSAGGYHQHIALNVWVSLGSEPVPEGATGVDHFAILYPTRQSLAQALCRALAAGVELEGAPDHGVSEALYFRDPDGNRVELSRDRPQSEWPRTKNGELAMATKALNFENLLSELGNDNPPKTSTPRKPRRKGR